MTRINCVPPAELCDQHLLAEFRELTRIPNQVLSGKLQSKYPGIDTYRLGEGHVKFFASRCRFLWTRYHKLYEECTRRGFRVTMIFPSPTNFHEAWGDWDPDEAAMALNRARIAERMPANPRWSTK